MTINNDKRMNFIQYLNTVLLTIVGLASVIIVSSISKIRNNQEGFAKQLIELKTIQSINVENIKTNDARLKTLELNYIDLMKTWVDANYVRKPQK